MRDRSGDLLNYWYVAALSAEVKQKPISSIILETRLVLWRNSEEKIIVQRDRCVHRNALLSKGHINKSTCCIVCPYHGWHFSENGECTKVPSEGPNQKKYRGRTLETFPSIEQEGLIWVWLGYRSPEDFPERKPFPMPFYNKTNDGWKTYYMKTEFNNNVTNLAENFMDVPHTVFVHRGWFRGQSQKRVGAIVERTDSSVLVTYDQEKDEIGFTDRILNPKKLPLTHTDKFYMPNNTRVDYIWGNNERAFVITSTITPISDLLSMVYTCISYKLGWLNALAPFWLPWYTRQVIQQDVDIMANQGEALREAPEVFKSTPADVMHLYIESLRSYALDPIGVSPKNMRKEIEFWI